MNIWKVVAYAGWIFWTVMITTYVTIRLIEAWS